jgi:hypothetical protein
MIIAFISLTNTSHFYLSIDSLLSWESKIFEAPGRIESPKANAKGSVALGGSKSAEGLHLMHPHVWMRFACSFKAPMASM